MKQTYSVNQSSLLEEKKINPFQKKLFHNLSVVPIESWMPSMKTKVDIKEFLNNN